MKGLSHFYYYAATHFISVPGMNAGIAVYEVIVPVIHGCYALEEMQMPFIYLDIRTGYY